jgi:AraC family transcriptional regulator
MTIKPTANSVPSRRLHIYPMGIACSDTDVQPVHGTWLVVPAGSTVVRATGLDELGVRTILKVAAPFVAVIPAAARLIHLVDSSGESPQGWVIALETALVGQASLKAFGVVSEWFKAWDPFLRSAADSLAALHHAQLTDTYADAFADVISVHLARCYMHRASATDPSMPLTRQMVASIQAFVHEHIDENLAVDRLAAQVHMSASHFARAFKITTGQSPHLYVTIQRVEFARTMLCDSTLPLVEVGACAGFLTQQRFTEVFHRHTGVTPRTFRLAHRTIGI